jgi:predicted enzyme related to lactoylglutathione lyase
LKAQAKEATMSERFVWFHNNSESPAEAKAFYEKLLGWSPADGPGGMTMFAGEKGPFAGLAPKGDATAGWLPYVQVDDVDVATKKAVKLGATVLERKKRGPAGEFSVVCDPGGAAIALWQKAQMRTVLTR